MAEPPPLPRQLARLCHARVAGCIEGVCWHRCYRGRRLRKEAGAKATAPKSAAPELEEAPASARQDARASEGVEGEGKGEGEGRGSRRNLSRAQN